MVSAFSFGGGSALQDKGNREIEVGEMLEFGQMDGLGKEFGKNVGKNIFSCLSCIDSLVSWGV